MASHDKREFAAVFIGGAAGTLLRAGLSQVLPTPMGAWPWATFVVNIVGTFLLGYFTTRLLERLPVSSYRRPLLGTGLCGGLTTFSTMQVEVVHMVQHQDYLLAAAYATASLATGFAALYFATAVVRRIRSGISQ